MRRPSMTQTGYALDDLGLGPDIKVFSVDIFDTLLLRRPLSETRRHGMVARGALADPRMRMLGFSTQTVRRARALAQEQAYRELELSGREGEVRLADVVCNQLALLALPHDLLPVFVKAELQAEQAAVLPNVQLVNLIMAVRRQGIRIVGLSDTALSRSELMAIVTAVVGHGVLDELYTSADLQATKRGGSAFEALCKHEGVEATAIHHLGDDRVADRLGAENHGITSHLIPRSTLHLLCRRLDALSFLIADSLGAMRGGRGRTRASNPQSETTLGPIVADFCMRLWLYLANIPNRDATVVLFCARGGINMHLALRHFATHLVLKLPLECRDIMLSRLAVLRGPLLAGSEAALDELTREFKGATLSDTAQALAGSDFTFDAEWHQPFEAEAFVRLLRDTATGAKLRGILAEQADLFSEHLASLTRGKNRVVLCDTGLYGSTIRLLREAYPQYEWECLLFARRNYKDFQAPHFSKTAGLSVQSDNYNPFNPRTAILRYWQLIESLFEPELSSVKWFHRSEDGSVLSNLEVPGWRQSIENQRPAFAAAMRYISSLDPYHWFKQLTDDCDRAWSCLRSAILFPAAVDIERLTIRAPTRDLGRDQAATVKGDNARGLSDRIDAINAAYWKEGYLAAAYPYWRLPLQAAMEAMYAIKFVVAALRRLQPRRRISVDHRTRPSTGSPTPVAGR
jgi:FMN phosphatase YigB (HAD superfamily)